MLLSDKGILDALSVGDLTIEPRPEPIQLQPASVDLRLSGWVRHFRTRVSRSPVDPLIGETYNDISVLESIDFSGFVLQPGEFILGSTVEQVSFGPRCAARLEGKSSIGRLGISIHVTAGFIDPGFTGHPTLEIVNFLSRPVRLTAGIPICQMAIHLLDQPSQHPYEERGSYTNQGFKPEPSRYWRKYGRFTAEPSKQD